MQAADYAADATNLQVLYHITSCFLNHGDFMGLNGVCDIMAGQISYYIESYRFFLFYAISFI